MHCNLCMSRYVARPIRKLLDCLAFANFGNFLHRKVESFHFWQFLKAIAVPKVINFGNLRQHKFTNFGNFWQPKVTNSGNFWQHKVTKILMWLLSNHKMMLKSFQTWQKHASIYKRWQKNWLWDLVQKFPKTATF